MLKPNDMAIDSEVRLSDGTEVALSVLLRQGRTMVVFLRHFG